MKRLCDALGIATRAWAVLAGLAALALVPVILILGGAMQAFRASAGSPQYLQNPVEKGLFTVLEKTQALLPDFLVRMDDKAGTFSLQSLRGSEGPAVVPSDGLTEYLRKHARAGSRVGVVIPPSESTVSPSHQALLKVLKDTCRLLEVEIEVIATGQGS